MSPKAAVAKLLPILEACEGSAEFLEAVQRTLETLLVNDTTGCPAGFAALDAAIEAFRAHDEATR
jgi:hypothetical protein